ncbi:MAG: DUF1326 domain-containing protein [Candidatus Dormibacteria bacterium]
MVDPPATWHVAGSYFEACNCEAVCPCRREGSRHGGRSTYGVCDFALSWLIADGAAAATDLSGLQVVLAGSYADDEEGSPWRVALYVDDAATQAQHDALAAIFLGRAGGDTLQNFAAAIGEIHAVRTARIRLDHATDREVIDVRDLVRVTSNGPAKSSGTVSCGIPGHDHPGQELVAETFWVRDPPLHWEVTGRCAFAADFAYSSGD